MKYNAESARERGLEVGVYHFFEPDQDAVAQADHFVGNVEKLGWTLPPVLDSEVLGKETETALDGKVLQWLERVHGKLKCKPIVYTGYSFWKTHFQGRLKGYRFWIAKYEKDPAAVPLSSPGSLQFWQFTDRGSESGVRGQIDLDSFVGDMNQLKDPQECERGFKTI